MLNVYEQIASGKRTLETLRTKDIKFLPISKYLGMLYIHSRYFMANLRPPIHSYLNTGLTVLLCKRSQKSSPWWGSGVVISISAFVT
jgi:hypothetical protein